jgi:O-acetyl-ADP-ribose deacetylase (regulator of RNase III)
MIAQSGIGHMAGPPLQYDALEICLTRVADFAKKYGFSVHMPRVGCGLGGGSWSKVEPIIERALEGVDVTVYDLPQRFFRS